MNKDFKKLKVAIIAGQGAEGCGVQRIGTELDNFCNANGMQSEFYAYYTGKKYSRQDAHGTKINFFNPKDIPALVDKLNKYDIVFFTSYPHAKTEHEAIKAFYHELFCKLTKPIKAMYNLEIMKMNIDKIGYLGLLTNGADVVFHYGLDTWYSKTVESLGIKKRGDRLHRFHLWMDFSELDEIKKLYPLEKKQNGLVSVTRWSSLKNIGRTIEIQNHLLKSNPDWFAQVHGVERSIGAKFDIINRPDVTYVNPSGKRDGVGAVEVYGPIVRKNGLELMGKNLYSSSFFSLPKTPWDYGNRLEYSQIENAYLSIPLFDTHWAQNNTNKEGINFFDIPYFALYSDGKDCEEIAKKMVQISKDKNEAQKYLETASYTVKNEYDCNIVIPQALELILNKGKQSNVLDDYEFNKKIVNEKFAEEVKKLEEKGEVPCLGLGEYIEQNVYMLDDKKQKLICKCKEKKIKKAKNNKLF